jgi:hypothetical protein
MANENRMSNVERVPTRVRISKRKLLVRTLFGAVNLAAIAMAVAGKLSWRSPPHFLDYGSIELAAPIMTSDEYDRVIATHPRPYIVELTAVSPGGGSDVEKILRSRGSAVSDGMEISTGFTQRCEFGSLSAEAAHLFNRRCEGGPTFTLRVSGRRALRGTCNLAAPLRRT